MNEFHLPPSDPRIMHMTLEQRDFVIANMNADIAEANGKKESATTDTTKDKWFTEPESEFSPIPKDMDAKKVLHNIGKGIGATQLYSDKVSFDNLRKQAIARHSWRVHGGKAAEKQAMQGLKQRAEKYKQKGIDKSNEWNKYLGKSQSTGHKGFDV